MLRPGHPPRASSGGGLAPPGPTPKPCSPTGARSRVVPATRPPHAGPISPTKSGEETAGRLTWEQGPSPHPPTPILPVLLGLSPDRAGQCRGTAEPTTPQPASPPAVATPLHPTLPAACPPRRLGGALGEERGTPAPQGGAATYPTVRESLHFNKGNISVGTLRVPAGATYQEGMSGLTPLQGSTWGTPDGASGLRRGWPLSQRGRTCRVTGADHGDLVRTQSAAAQDGLGPLQGSSPSQPWTGLSEGRARRLHGPPPRATGTSREGTTQSREGSALLRRRPGFGHPHHSPLASRQAPMCPARLPPGEQDRGSH